MSQDAKPPATASGPTTDDRYKIGTLHYTKAGLFSLFGWMIMANLCFTLFEGQGGAGSIPFYLQENFHIRNVMVSILFNFIPMIIGTVMTGAIFFVGMGEWKSALCLFVLANIGFACGNLFYDSLLVDVAEHD